MKDILNNNRILEDIICIRTFIWTRTLQELRKAIVSIDKTSLVRSAVANNSSELLEVLKDDVRKYLEKKYTNDYIHNTQNAI